MQIPLLQVNHRVERGEANKKILQFVILVGLSMTGMCASSEEELKACLQQIFTTYFQATSLLFYDARTEGLGDRRSLLPPSEPNNAGSILRIAQGNVSRLVEVSNPNHQIIEINRFKRVKPQSSIFLLDEDHVKTWQTSGQVFHQIKLTENWNRQGRTLILVHKTNSTRDNSQMAKFANFGIWRWNKAVNVVIMIAEPHNISFYTWFPYRQPSCFRTGDLPLYEAWSEGRFQHGKNLYPKKMKNDLEGCWLRVAAADCLPYSFENYTKGFEASMVHTLAEHHNFKMHTVALPEDQDMWMNRLQNGTLAGAIGLLDRQDADLAFACLMLTLERYNLAECLPIYFHDSLTWFIPTPNINSHASNIFEAFPQRWWIAIFLTAVMAVCVFVLTAKLEELVLTSGAPTSLIGASLRVFAMAISSPITWSSKKTLVRMFTFAFAIYSLHITTIYQASLYSLYRSNSYSNVYHSLEDAVDNNLFVWLRPSTKDLYNSTDAVWKNIMQTGHHGYIEDLADTFNQVAYDKSAITLFIKSTMLVYIKEAYTIEKKPQILYLPQQFSSYPVTLYLSPGHPMYQVMTMTVEYILAGGFVDHWKREVVSDTEDVVEHLATNVSLQFEHISGALMFYAALMTLAAGIFLVEKVYWVTHGRKNTRPLRREDLNLRRQLLFRTVVDMGRERVGTRLARFRH